MYYDHKNQIIIQELPKNSIGPDGQLHINFDTTNNINLWANHNYYSIRNDNTKPSEDYEEDINKRIVILDKPYADISRTWKLIVSPPEPTEE